ncbi:MAG TPA: DoxX family protein [Edaphobacter sp.]|nr:DoxX family protein [Edaphobacter sp.]
MQGYAEVAQGVSIVAFTWYGLECFFSRKMVAEFERYQVPSLRKVTGGLQLAGSLAMLLGYFYLPLLRLSAAGFAVMMFFAVLTRFRIRDPLYAAIPAFSLLALNTFILIASLKPAWL